MKQVLVFKSQNDRDTVKTQIIHAMTQVSKRICPPLSEFYVHSRLVGNAQLGCFTGLYVIGTRLYDHLRLK